MTTTDTAATALRARLDGDALTPGDTGYEDA
jgi:hypothetical protein